MVYSIYPQNQYLKLSQWRGHLLKLPNPVILPLPTTLAKEELALEKAASHMTVTSGSVLYKLT